MERFATFDSWLFASGLQWKGEQVGACSVGDGRLVWPALRTSTACSPGRSACFCVCRLSLWFALSSRFIIHTVGPRYHLKYHNAAENALYNCYRNSLAFVREKRLKSVGVPCLYVARRCCCVVASSRQELSLQCGSITLRCSHHCNRRNHRDKDETRATTTTAATTTTTTTTTTTAAADHHHHKGHRQLPQLQPLRQLLKMLLLLF